jgi:hypothetical protein
MKLLCLWKSLNIIALPLVAGIALSMGGCGILQGKVSFNVNSSGGAKAGRNTNRAQAGSSQASRGKHANSGNRAGSSANESPHAKRDRAVAKATAGSGGLTAWSERQAARYEGAECGEALLKLGWESNSRPRATGLKHAKPREQVLLAICARRTYKKKYYKKLFSQQVKVAPIGLDAYHPAIDDRNPDPVSIALSVYWIGELIQVRVNELNAPIPSFLWQATSKQYRPSQAIQKLALYTGLGSLYGKLITEGALRKAVEKLGLPASASEAMMQQFSAAKKIISERVTKMSRAERLLYVKLPVKVRADRKKVQKKFSSLYAKMDSLIAAGGVSDVKTLKDAEGIRRKFLKACKKCDPMEHEVFVETTKAITVWHLKQKDGLTAEAEWKSFRDRDAFRHTLPHALNKATATLGKKMDAALAERQRAEKAGVKLKTGIGGNTTPPLYFRSNNQIQLSWRHPDVTQILSRRLSYPRFKAKVARVKKKGSKAKIIFVKKKVTWEEEYACRRTNRVSRVTRDGDVQYEENCRYRKRSEMRPTHEPIEIPSVEAKLIRGGDEIQGVWDRKSKEGRLQSASRRGKRVAYRTSSL